MGKGDLQFRRPSTRRMPWWLALILISLVVWAIAYMALLFV